MTQSNLVPPPHVVRSLRIGETQLTQILDRLEDASGNSSLNRLSGRGYPYHGKQAVIHVSQGDTAYTFFRTSIRHIRSDATRFLHGAFLHIGSPCTIQLITIHGAWNEVAGRVAACHHLAKNIHVVQVEFDTPIDVELYSRTVRCPRVLVVEDRDLVAKVACLQLANLGATVERARNGTEAVEMALREPYDIVLMDMCMPELDGFSATPLLREKDYSGLIVAVTALPRDEDRERCFAAGCDHFMPKPYTSQNLAELIDSLWVEPLSSTLADEPGMAELIDGFVESLEPRMAGVESAVRGSDAESLTDIVRDLKAEGTMYGFEPISTCAADIESALLGGTPVPALRGKTYELSKLCRNARPVFDAHAKEEPTPEAMCFV